MKAKIALIILALYLTGWYVNTAANYAYWVGWSHDTLHSEETYMDRLDDAAFSAGTSLVPFWWPVLFFTTDFYHYGFAWKWYRCPKFKDH